MYKVLIADSSQMLAAQLQRQLCAGCSVLVWQETEDLPALVQQRGIDLVVLDIMMSGMDGMDVLQRLAKLYPRPEILVTSRYISGYATEAIMGLGADYIMVKPCSAEQIAARVKDMLRYRYGLHSSGCSEEEEAYAHARRLGVAAHLKGSRYLREALRLMRQDPTQQITKELYPAIGAQFHVSAQRVERCIRTAIHTAWENRDERIWQMYFGTDASGHIPRPTNAGFLACILEHTHFAA